MIKKTTKKIDATALQALRVRRLEAAMAALWSALVVPVGAFGGPQGGNVVEGVAQVQPITPTLTNIRQTTDRAVIEWQSFSIEKGERVNFEQPKATSAVLNRVIGLDPSTIAGELSANGQVFLVNPAGILFKNGAKIDTHSFVGAVADITNTNFMSGKLVFDEFDAQRSATATIKLEADASILARGSAASAGLAALVAPGVENAGVIEARLGQVIIGGAQRFTLDLTGDGLYSFAVDDGVVESLVGASGSAAVSVAESGRIVAKGGLVLLSAGVASDFIGDAINLEGHVFARSVSVDSKGEVVLDSCAAGLSCGGVSVGANAVIDAAGAEAGQSGGSIRIVGEDVALEARAELIASGEKDGGRIAIEAGSTLASSADLFTNGGTGLGGTIDIRSSGAVDVSGTLSAAGNNGTVAVTVAGEIDFSAAVTAKTFDIESTSASPLVIADEEGIRSQSVGDALLRGANTTLWSSSDVTIEGDVIGRNDGGSGAGSLTIDAGGDIAIASGVSVLTQGGALRLNASGNVSAAPSSTVGSDEGQVEIVAAGDVRLGQVAAGGTLDVRTTSGDIFITRSIGSAEAPEQTPSAISLTASAGDIVIMHPSVTENTRPEERLGLLTEAGSGHGSINARAFGQIIVNGQIVAAGNVTLHADRISLRQSIFTKGGDILIKAPGGIELDPSGRAEETFAREGLENILSNEDGRYEEIENYDCKARGGCVLGANGETVPVFQELSIRSRGLTISTGDTGAGTISFLGPVDIPSRLQDWRNSDDEHALRWTRTGADGELVYRGATEGPDPSLYYVTLTLEAESTSFMDGLAAGRKPVLSESSGDTPSAVGDGFNSVELVLLRGDLLAGAPIRVNALCRRSSCITTENTRITIDGVVVWNLPLDVEVPDDWDWRVPEELEFMPHQIAEVFGTNVAEVVDVDNNPIEHVPLLAACIEYKRCNQPPIFPIPGTAPPSVPGKGSPLLLNSHSANPAGNPTILPVESLPALAPFAAPPTAPDSVDEVLRLTSDVDTTLRNAVIGGPGVARSTDLGRTSPSTGLASELFRQGHHVAQPEGCVTSDESGTCLQDAQGNDYFRPDLLRGRTAER